MHAGIHFNMNAHRLLERFIQLIYSVFQLREATEAVDIRFKIVKNDSVEGVRLRRHHHDRQFDATVAQIDTLVGIRNSKIINMMEGENI